MRLRPFPPGWQRRVVALLTATLAALLLAPQLTLADAVLAEEPVIPGIDWATDFQIAPEGDVYVAHHDGQIVRYRRLAGSSAAHPRYALTPQPVHTFQTTRQFDRGLVGITLDSGWDSGHRYLYALITRGSQDFVQDHPNGVRRTAAVVRIAVPAQGPAQPSDLKTIVGADAPADPDASCRPFTAGQAPPGETDALPNGVVVAPPPDESGDPGTVGGKIPYFTEGNVYPDGDLATPADSAYDCIPSDGDTHGLGGIASAPDGSLLLSVGDSTPWQTAAAASLRAYNLESYAGKILRVDRSGRGFTDSPFCPQETDTRKVCTKLWALGLRNAFRFSLLPADAQSAGGPALAIGDVGNYTFERLTVAHPGDNLGWPCWEGTYWNYFFASPSAPSPARTAWGGPGLTPVDGGTSCQRLASGAGAVPQPQGVRVPHLQYHHEQGTGSDGAAIVAGPQLQLPPGSDPAVALPAAWAGSLVFGDYARGWVQRVAVDGDDPAGADADGGLRWPADVGRATPTVRTETTGSPQDELIERIAEPPSAAGGVPPWYRLTMRQGPDGTLWSMRYQGSSSGGAIYRLRTAPAVAATIEHVSGACAADAQTPVVLRAADAGPEAAYAWDLDGDGATDAGRTGRETTISPAELTALRGGPGWIRLTVTAGESRSVATRYLCLGPTPDVSITSPADDAEVVLGEPVVVSAQRPAGDAAATGIPDERLRWEAKTVHGSSHEHTLLDRTGATEVVDGEARMQFTVTPDDAHELGSYTRVRLYAPESDGGGGSRTITLRPKPVTVTLRSEPAGARVAMVRDIGHSVVEQAPGQLAAAAGFSTSLEAAATFTDDAGQRWTLRDWSDGRSGRSRQWRVPAGGGAAPAARYDRVPADPEPAPVPDPQPNPQPSPDPAPNPGAPNGPPAPGLPGVAPIGPLALEPAELRRMSITVQARGPRSRRAAVRLRLRPPRSAAAGDLVVKLAVRDAKCRWWSFGKRRFTGLAVSAPAARGTAAGRRRCKRAPAWKRAALQTAASTWRADARLGARLPRGAYAVRVRLISGGTLVSERARRLRNR